MNFKQLITCFHNLDTEKIWTALHRGLIDRNTAEAFIVHDSLMDLVIGRGPLALESLGFLKTDSLPDHPTPAVPIAVCLDSLTDAEVLQTVGLIVDLAH